jgi:hypothetical protein
MRNLLGLILCLFLSATASSQRVRGNSAECRDCHSEGATQPSTTMGHALETTERCKVLKTHPVLTTSVGKYRYRISRQGDRSIYSVTDGSRTITIPIRWAVGASFAIGQTYILENGGKFYESRVSWFRELNGLGPTLGSQNSLPANLEDAVGRVMGHDDLIRCLGCHATDAVSKQKLTLQTLVPGVQCGHCHGDLAKHLSDEIGVATFAPQLPGQSFHIEGRSAQQVADFCGNCHRTWAQIASQGNPSIANVRFQPYRLTESQCFDPYDPRISCLACHDPHQEVDSRPADYDAKCKACHAGGKTGAKTCSVSTSECVTCHMPKLELPGAHFRFTDHRIRIVKPGEPYPG